MSNTEQEPGPLLTARRQALVAYTQERERWDVTDEEPTEAEEAYLDQLAKACDDTLDALVASEEPVPWILSEQGCDYRRVWARTIDEALSLAADDGGDYGERHETIWVQRYVRSPDRCEEGVTTVTLEPKEPKCTRRDGHEWSSAIELVGGIKENPGVWGSGGGVKIHRACIHCALGRTTDTWAQNPVTGEQGLESVTYTPDQYRAELERFTRLSVVWSEHGEGGFLCEVRNARDELLASLWYDSEGATNYNNVTYYIDDEHVSWYALEAFEADEWPPVPDTVLQGA